MKTVSLFDLVTLLSAIGCGLVAGVFFAFSSLVMKGLGALPPAQGIAAMQAINVAVVNPWFMTPFLGPALASGFLVISSFRGASEPAAPYLLAGNITHDPGHASPKARKHETRTCRFGFVFSCFRVFVFSCRTAANEVRRVLVCRR